MYVRVVASAIVQAIVPCGIREIEEKLYCSEMYDVQLDCSPNIRPIAMYKMLLERNKHQSEGLSHSAEHRGDVHARTHLVADLHVQTPVRSDKGLGSGCLDQSSHGSIELSTQTERW